MNGADTKAPKVEDVTSANERSGEDPDQSQRLELIGALASGVAHDFNNLLMGIIGCADISLSKLNEDHPARAPVTEIRNAALRGTANVSQLVTFCRKRPAHREVVDLNEIVSDTYRMLSKLIGEDVRLDVALAPTPVCTLGDECQFEQILLNLAINARHAMPEGGTFTVETAVIGSPISSGDAQMTQAEPQALITVSDTGCGMDLETQRRAFEPFFTTKATGTGLGLSTVRAIVEQNGGRIELESEVGRGTTFRIYLPFVEHQERKSSRPSSIPPAVDQALILVVDDEPLVRLALEHYLTQGGYRVLSAADAQTALAIARARSEPIAFVVSDIVLPGMRGPDLVREVKNLRPNIGALLLSAHPSDDLLAQGLIDESACVLQKPVDPEALLLAVGRGIAEASKGEVRLGSSTDDSATTGVLVGRRSVILLVDDDDLTRETLRELFENEGYEVLEGVSGRDAQRISNEHEGPIDLLITDICLYDADGLDLVNRLDATRSDMAVLYLSGWPGSDPAVKKAVRQRANTDFLQKPVAFEDLVMEVKHLLAAQRKKPGA